MKKSIRPYMTNNEILLFKKYLLKSENYIEFGAGGSTLYAIENNNTECDRCQFVLDIFK